MSEAIKPRLLHNDQVHALNEKHGWFEFRDAQSDVSRAFASDAIAEYERVRNEATAVCVATGLTPRQLVERVKELEEACRHCEDLFMRHEINRANGEEIADGALVILRAALSKSLPNTVAEVK